MLGKGDTIFMKRNILSYSIKLYTYGNDIKVTFYPSTYNVGKSNSFLPIHIA